MRQIFIADAHLRKGSDHNYRMLLRFLSTLEGKTETLYILGDLFEFCIDYQPDAYPHYQPVLQQLLSLKAHGTRIVYVEGNHDFHLGTYFSEVLQAEVHSGPAVIDPEGKRVLVCHGDEINSRDPGYRLLRSILRSRISRMIIPLVPVRLTSLVAERMSRQSSKKHGSRRSRWDYPRIIREFARHQFEQGCEIVICGHFHLPFLDRSPGPNGDRVLLSLGDWISQFSYGEWLDGHLSLNTFRDTSA